MPVHKSDEGWARLRSNVRSRRGIRASMLEHRPRRKVTARQPSRPAVEQAEEFTHLVELPVESARMRGRRRFAFE
jgi:hypothetical protein